MRRYFCTTLLVITLTAITMTFSGIAFSHPNKGVDCSRCHNSKPAPPTPDNTTPLKSAGTNCKKTYQDALKSCQFGVQDTYWLGIAKCDNLPSSETKTCKLQSRADMKAGNEECKEQSDSRKEICKDLGQGIYDPVINPSDFSTTINNPYFPLVPGTTFVYEGTQEGNTEHNEVMEVEKCYINSR